MEGPAPFEGLPGGWTLILADTKGRLWVAQTDSGGPVTATTGSWEGSAALWSQLDAGPVARGLTLQTWSAFRLEPISSGSFKYLRWELRDTTGALASGGGALVRDRRYGVWRVRGPGQGVVGGESAPAPLRFDLISDTPLPSDTIVDPMPAGSVVVRTPVVVSLRLDDCMVGDAESFRLLQALGLTAELGVPSRRIDRRGNCTQGMLEEMVAAGDRVESHSRTHRSAPEGFGDFYLETVGAAQDLRARGFDPRVFIPPGTWKRGAALLDAPEKLAGPYGALLRRTYVTTDINWFPTMMRVPVAGRNGPSSWPLKALSVAGVEARIRLAAIDSLWINFMWHSFDMRSADLEARLRVIAALRDSGLVTVLPFYSALHATR